MNHIQVTFRNVLLSSGSLTPEAVISDGQTCTHECAPEGLTTGLKEKTTRRDILLPSEFLFEDKALSQQEFDSTIAQNFSADISTALSLAYLRFASEKSGYNKNNLYEFVSKSYSTKPTYPKLIFNILNGGKHAGNGLSFCEFMIIPKTNNPILSVTTASEIYHDLRSIILEKYGERDVLVGREGGFAPHLDSTDTAFDLIVAAINKRHAGEVSIAIDVAANHFCKQDDSIFIYDVNGEKLTTTELLSYYSKILTKHPEITYIEDCFHENDLEGWSAMIRSFGNLIEIVADDLTVTNILYTTKYLGLYNSCILKVNQVGTFSELVETFRFCKQNNIKTIISQRSGETDSNILPHLAVGLGADYMKAGAPARERIIKYNELMRMSL